MMSVYKISTDWLKNARATSKTIPFVISKKSAGGDCQSMTPLSASERLSLSTRFEENKRPILLGQKGKSEATRKSHV
jgi:hypothetical protein